MSARVRPSSTARSSLESNYFLTLFRDCPTRLTLSVDLVTRVSDANRFVGCSTRPKLPLDSATRLPDFMTLLSDGQTVRLHATRLDSLFEMFNSNLTLSASLETTTRLDSRTIGFELRAPDPKSRHHTTFGLDP